MSTSLDISRAYRLILQLARNSRAYSQSELEELSAEEKSATHSVELDVSRFLRQLSCAERAIADGDASALSASLIDARIAVMRIAADLENLREEIDVLYRRSAIPEDLRPGL